MFKRLENHSFEIVDGTPHPDYEVHETSVAEYFRKYSVGKTDNMPTDPRPECPPDERSETEMLEDDSVINTLGCDDLDVLQEINDNSEKFKAALEDIELTKTQRKQFEEATAIIDDPNASLSQKREAYAVLESLNEKVTRARNT